LESDHIYIIKTQIKLVFKQEFIVGHTIVKDLKYGTYIIEEIKKKKTGIYCSIGNKSA
jgi:hypothetical protein